LGKSRRLPVVDDLTSRFPPSGCHPILPIQGDMHLATNYELSTAQDGKTFFTGESHFLVKEIEVLEIKR
jgi:hypothetical protein